MGSSFGNFVGGFLVGAAIGAVAVIFTAPKSGDSTRADLSALWTSAVDTGKRVAKEREDELWAEFNSKAATPAGVPPVI
jgi:gas vesicle protein